MFLLASDHHYWSWSFHPEKQSEDKSNDQIRVLSDIRLNAERIILLAIQFNFIAPIYSLGIGLSLYRSHISYLSFHSHKLSQIEIWKYYLQLLVMSMAIKFQFLLWIWANEWIDHGDECWVINDLLAIAMRESASSVNHYIYFINRYA